MNKKEITGYVYIIKSDSSMKVGMTKSPRERFRNYATHNPSAKVERVVVSDEPTKLEAEVLTLFFSGKKDEGTDWVKIDEKLLKKAIEIIEEKGQVVSFEKDENAVRTDKFEVPFTMVANQVLRDPNLSLKAKGLFGYIYSKPNEWDFSYLRIAEESKDGKDSVLSALKELEVQGYLKRKKRPTGRVDYYLTYDPEPNTENPTQATQTRKSRTISKKDTTTIINRDNNNITYGAENPTPTPNTDNQSFFDVIIANGEEFQVFVSKMSESTKFPPAFVAEELKLFTLYWTEKNKSGKKQRWQTETTFEVRRRLVTWFNNKRTNFGRNNAGTVNGGANKYQVDFTKK